MFDHALKALETPGDVSIPPSLLHLVRLFRQNYLDRGRMPADDVIDKAAETPTTPQRMMGDNAS